MANIPWLVVDALGIPKNLHPLPRHHVKVLSKFNPDKKLPIEDHVNKFMLALILLNVEH